MKDHDVLLFMKGTPTSPQCGFSAQAVAILQAEGIDFSSADVLASNEVRNAIKEFSSWPTIPQLYVSGEFVGGCDIISKLFLLLSAGLGLLAQMQALLSSSKPT